MLQAQFIGKQTATTSCAISGSEDTCCPLFTSFNFTIHQITSLHYTSFPIFHFPPVMDVSSPSLKILHFSSHIKICDLEGKVARASAGTWFHSLIVLFTEQYLPISVLLFTGPNFTIVTIPAQVAWSYLPVHYRLPRRNIFCHYVVMLVFENIRLCEWM